MACTCARCPTALHPVLVYMFFVSFAFNLKKSTFSMIAPTMFKMTPADLGFFMSYNALLGVVANTFFMSGVVKKYGEMRSLEVF